MYPETLEKLIEYAIADGILTDSERKILFKKAESLGIDLDEFEMVLKGRLLEKKNVLNSPPPLGASQSIMKTTKLGDVKKCPSCGTVIESTLAVKCSACGYEFRNIDANSSLKALSDKLDEVSKRGDNVQIAQIIRNYPISSSKEDIFEFLHFIEPKTKINIGDERFIDAWYAKGAEVISKGKLLFQNDQDALLKIGDFERRIKPLGFLERRKLEQKLQKLVPKKEKKTLAMALGCLIKGFIICVIAYILFYVIFGLFLGVAWKNNTDKEQAETRRLELLITDIERAIEAKEYDKALFKASQLQWSSQSNMWNTPTELEEKKENWKARQEAIIKQIEILKNK